MSPDPVGHKFQPYQGHDHIFSTGIGIFLFQEADARMIHASSEFLQNRAINNV